MKYPKAKIKAQIKAKIAENTDFERGGGWVAGGGWGGGVGGGPPQNLSFGSYFGIFWGCFLAFGYSIFALE